MTIKEVIDGFREGVGENVERNAYANELFQEAVRIGMELNMQYHTPEEIREIMGRLIGKKVDASFRMFPPFYTDFGKNITIGKDVFINSGCHFQDQGGIQIGDGALIGHNVVLATINHDLNPEENRKNHYAPITIGAHVWIGSNVTILPGVTLGDWAVVAAGAVVTQDVPPRTVVGGVPAKVLKVIPEERTVRYEAPEVMKTEEGLRFTVHGLSPIAVAWKSVKTDKPPVNPGPANPSIPGNNDTPTQPGTQQPSGDSDSYTPDSGSKKDTGTVTAAANRRSPQTGDDNLCGRSIL